MRIIFQGDSITDAGRDRSNPHNLAGYTTITAELLGKDNEYLNFGISGDTSAMVLERINKEFAEFGAPDVFTLLIGINDVWRRFDSNSYTSPDSYYASVKAIIGKVKAVNPNCRIVLIEPFLLPACDKAHWVGDLAFIIQKLRKIAVEEKVEYLPMDGILARACLTTPWQDLSADGVHPLELGNRVIAECLAEEIKRVTK